MLSFFLFPSNSSSFFFWNKQSNNRNEKGNKTAEWEQATQNLKT